MILWKLLRWLPGYFKVVKTTACADFYHLLQLVVVHVIVPLSGKPIHSKNEVWVWFLSAVVLTSSHKGHLTSRKLLPRHLIKSVPLHMHLGALVSLCLFCLPRGHPNPTPVTQSMGVHCKLCSSLGNEANYFLRTWPLCTHTQTHTHTHMRRWGGLFTENVFLCLCKHTHTPKWFHE